MDGKIQPIRHAMHAERWSVRALAVRCNVTYWHMKAVVYGNAHPCDHLRQVLPEILGVPLTQLFDPEILARPYSGSVEERAGEPMRNRRPINA